MSCAACQARVEKAVGKVPGVTSCSVSLLTNSMGVEGSAAESEIIQAVEAAGYGASPKMKEETSGNGGSTEYSEIPALKRRLLLSVCFLALLMYISMGNGMWGWPVPAFLEENFIVLAIIQMVLAATVMVINNRFFTSGTKALLHGAPNMDTLVALGSFVSFCWSFVVLVRLGNMTAEGAAVHELHSLYHTELYFESAAMIPALITIGKLLEAISKGRTTDALKSLIRLAPKKATLLRDGTPVEVGIEEVKKGDIFAVRAGEAVPVDGVVLEGESAVDESLLTGESVPVEKEPGSVVSAATISRSGYLKCEATRVGKDTTLSQIIRMVEEAAATKAPIARIADKVSGIFVPAVILIAVLVIGGWLISGETMSFALARGISVLVISCPCALGLATPVAIMVGNGVGAKNGILFKTGEALETTGRLELILLDKTGTITEGTPKVTDLIPGDGISETDLLKKAAAVESRSEHPLARAILAYAEEKAEAVPSDGLKEFRTLPGNGVRALLDGKEMCGGSGRYIRTVAAVPEVLQAKEAALSEDGKTVLYFAEEKRLLGMIAVADRIRPDSAEAIRELTGMGLEVVMLTGDNEKTAGAIARQAGIPHVAAGILPDGKEALVNRLKDVGKTAMVGDGINDAPALTRADVGIAIGAGTDVAIDSADIVLMNSSLRDVAAAVRLSKGTLRNIHQNLFWAFFYNIICIPVAAGLFQWKMNPMIGAAAMSLSSVTVCLNALRLNLLNIRKVRPGSAERKGSGAIGEKVMRILAEMSTKQSRSETLMGSIIQNEERKKEKMEKTVKIQGMMCGHCEANVKKAMEALPFVESAVVSHEAGTAVLTLSGEPDEAAIKKAVEDRDYTFCGME